MGNNAVHPGQIDLRDNPEIAARLFQLVNIIIEKMVSEPREIKALFDNLPEVKKTKSPEGMRASLGDFPQLDVMRLLRLDIVFTGHTAAAIFPEGRVSGSGDGKISQASLECFTLHA